MQFWQSLQKHLAWRPGNVHLLSKKYTKFFFPENKNFFPDVFLGTRRMQFRQQLKKFRQQAEIVCSTSKNDRRSKLFLEVFFPKLFLWTGGMKALWQTRWKILNRMPKNLRSLSKSEEGNKSWWEVFFRRSVPMVTVKAILLTPLEQVPRKAEFITAVVR